MELRYTFTLQNNWFIKGLKDDNVLASEHFHGIFANMESSYLIGWKFVILESFFFQIQNTMEFWFTLRNFGFVRSPTIFYLKSYRYV